MPSNHLILCRPLLLLPSIFPSIRVFSNESALRIRWPKYWSFSFSISPYNDYSGLISFRWYLYKGLVRNSLSEKLSCKHLSLQFEELTAGGVLSSPGDQLFHTCLLRASPWHAVLWAQGPVDASRGSTWQSGGSHGSGGADTPGQTWVRSRACAVRRKQRPDDDACVQGDRLGGLPAASGWCGTRPLAWTRQVRACPLQRASLGLTCGFTTDSLCDPGYVTWSLWTSTSSSDMWE